MSNLPSAPLPLHPALVAGISTTEPTRFRGILGKTGQTLFGAIVALALLGAVAQPGRAQTPQNPFPITGPTTITQSGYYQLQNNINSAATSGTIIQVNASNVTIDFNGFYIAGPVSNSAQQVYGIQALERSNLTIKDGTIAFCQIGMFINGVGDAATNNVGHRIENMRVTYCYTSGIRVLGAPGSRVAFNQVSKIGGSTVSANANATGIDVTGPVQVNDNQINGVTATGNGVARGIYGSNNGNIMLRNTITDATRGVDSGKYKDNVTFNCATPFTGGTDAGGNN